MFKHISNSEIKATLKRLGLTEKDILSQDTKCEDIFGIARDLPKKKTIMPKNKIEMFRQIFTERHKNALKADICNLSAAIKFFNGKNVTVWHCCNHDGCGYYTVTDGKAKRYAASGYILECAGGCWSMHVYERLYFAQVYLTKFLKAVKAEICKRFSVYMPLKSLYIAYIMTDLNIEEKREMPYYHNEDKCDFEIAREHQRKFAKNHADEIEQYNNAVRKGFYFWEHYNGYDNYEYSYVADVIEETIFKIYGKREQLEVCGLWDKARETIKKLHELKYKNKVIK